MFWSKSKEQSQTESNAGEGSQRPVPVSNAVMERYGVGRRGSVTSSVARSSVDDDHSSAHRHPLETHNNNRSTEQHTPGTPPKVEEDAGDIEEHLYEVNMPVKHQSWLRRHWFVIAALAVGLTLAAVLVGVCIVKFGVSAKANNDAYSHIPYYITGSITHASTAAPAATFK